MPGYVMHLAVCERIISECNITDEAYKAYFRIGNLAPDTRKRAEKKESHFWTDDVFSKFVRKPDTDTFFKQYGNRLSDPYVCGYYTHLMFDKSFLDNYWDRHFKFLGEDGREEELFDKVTKVMLTDTGTVYDRDLFLSDRIYYGDYDVANDYIVGRYGISYEACLASYAYVMESVSTEAYDIGGVSILDSKKQLTDMISCLKNVNAKSASSKKRPKLEVFDIDELEALIEAFVCEMKLLHRE